MTSTISVFIGSSTEGIPIVKTIAEKLEAEGRGELKVDQWTDDSVFKLNQSTLESLTNAAMTHDFAILVATADDSTRVRDQRVFQARDNVIFELGLFMGRLGRARTFLVCSDNKTLRLPSDLSGITVLRFNQQEVDAGNPSALEPTCKHLLKAILDCTDKDGGFFVLFPSLRDDPFYLELLAGVAAPSSGTRDVTFLLPHQAYSGSQFLERLDDLVNKQRGFKGGLIAATLSGIEAADIRERVERFRIPIVLVDINPYEGEKLPAHVQYVGVDNAEGGRLAAAYIRQALAGVKTPRVLVLANDDQPKRHQAFLAELGQSFDTKVVPCQWSAAEGRRLTEHALTHYADDSSPFHAIFGVSDEIALGATAVLSKFASQPDATKIIVVGFDGTSWVRSLIDLKISGLRNTVIQDAYQMGEHAMALLRQIVDGKPPAGGKSEHTLGVHLYI
jgi:ABC-type sugar transport system substrate-binding protein